MGHPMAGHLAKAGHDVTVYNRTASKAADWADRYGGATAPTPAAAAAGAEVVVTIVGNDDDLRQVVTGPDGAFAAMAAGAILIDHTTASAEVARELNAAATERGGGFVDAPVSGGQAGAENGQLTIMVGGDQATYDTAAPVMEVYAKSVRRMGEAGAGQLCKMVNQVCIAGLVQGMSEAMLLAERAGLDLQEVVDVISKGAAGSWQMENRWPTMAKGAFDFGFAVDWMRKDLGIVLAEAKTQGLSLPVTALVDQFYGDVQAMGGGRWDTSSLVARLRKLAP